MINKYKALDCSKYENYLIRQLFSITQSMFVYKGDDDFRFDMLELFNQIGGNAIVAEYDGKLYPFFGGYGGEPNAYYEPTKYIVANPALKLNKTFTIDEDCILFRNTHEYNSLFPMFERYAKRITENEKTLDIVAILQRAQLIISASDDKSLLSAQSYIDDILRGKLATIADPDFLEGIKVHPYPSGGETLKALIEFNQYTRATFFHDIGLNANYNMKRESIVSREADLNTDVLIPLVGNMLTERKKSVEKVNKMFNKDWSVELGEPWKQLRENDQRDVLSGECNSPGNMEQGDNMANSDS